MNTQKRNLVIAFAAAILVILLVATGGLTIYEIYYKTNDSAPVRGIASVLNLPAAKVGSRTVSYIRFLQTRDAVKRFINSDAGKEVKAVMPPEATLNQSVLDRLMRQEIVQEIADQQKVTVSDNDVSSVFADVVKAAASSTTPDVSQYLWDNYGWHEEDFRQQVLRPALLEQQLGNTLAQANNGDKNALENAITARHDQPDVVVYLKF